MSRANTSNHSVAKTVERLSQVVEKQFGCPLAFETLDAISHDHALIYTDLHKGEPVSAGDWVFFPVFMGQDLAGAARISNRDRITQQTMKRLHSIIRLVIENNLSNQEQLTSLDEIEKNLSAQVDSSPGALANRNPGGKVLRLRDYQHNEFQITKPATNSAFNFFFFNRKPFARRYL